MEWDEMRLEALCVAWEETKLGRLPKPMALLDRAEEIFRWIIGVDEEGLESGLIIPWPTQDEGPAN